MNRATIRTRQRAARRDVIPRDRSLYNTGALGCCCWHHHRRRRRRRPVRWCLPVVATAARTIGRPRYYAASTRRRVLVRGTGGGARWPRCWQTVPLAGRCGARGRGRVRSVRAWFTWCCNPLDAQRAAETNQHARATPSFPPPPSPAAAPETPRRAVNNNNNNVRATVKNTRQKRARPRNRNLTFFKFILTIQ